MAEPAATVEVTIEGVRVLPLAVHPDERGWLFEILRADDAHFLQFGQIYLSAAHPGVIKAWHAHERQTDYQCVVDGRALVGLYDDRDDSPTRGQTMAIDARGEEPVLILIPPGVWHGYMTLGDQRCLVVNIPTDVYTPDAPDELRRDPHDPAIPFTWAPPSD